MYATDERVRDQLAPFTDLALPDDLTALISAAEHEVDLRLGPYAPDPETGRKLDPVDLTHAQAGALAYATALAVGYLAAQEMEEALGMGDLVPALVRPVAGAGLGARIDAALAGLGLIARSGCALPTPEPVEPEP